MSACSPRLCPERLRQQASIATCSLCGDWVLARGRDTRKGSWSNVLGMADYDLQTKVREAMTTRARDLRVQASTMTYPQAIDAIDAYAELCTPQAAKALTRSALTAVTTTVAPSGAISAAPVAATAVLASVAVKESEGDRIVQWWAPGNVVQQDREDKLIAWMGAHGVNTSIAFFATAKGYGDLRKQAVADLAIPGESK
jgi:hypothetical protein